MHTVYKEPRHNQSYASPQGIRLLRELTEQGLYIFTSTDARALAPQCGIAPRVVTNLLYQLAAAGWVQRLRNGLYAGTGSLPGDQRTHPFAIATRLVEPSFISHWSALQQHGLTEQLPQRVTASTPCKVTTPSMRNVKQGERSTAKHYWAVGELQIEYITIHSDHVYGIEEIWIDQLFRVPTTDRERTALDLCVAPRYFGGMTEVLGILEEHWHTLDIRDWSIIPSDMGRP